MKIWDSVYISASNVLKAADKSLSRNPFIFLPSEFKAHFCFVLAQAIMIERVDHVLLSRYNESFDTKPDSS